MLHTLDDGPGISIKCRQLQLIDFAECCFELGFVVIALRKDQQV